MQKNMTIARAIKEQMDAARLAWSQTLVKGLVNTNQEAAARRAFLKARRIFDRYMEIGRYCNA